MGLEVFENAPIGYILKLKYRNAKRHHSFLLKTDVDRYASMYSHTSKNEIKQTIAAKWGVRYDRRTLESWSTLVTNPPTPPEDILWD